MSHGEIRTAVELWDAIEVHAGLQLRRRRNGEANYDTMLLDALRSELALPTGPIRKGLRSRNCKLETLLSALLLTLEPWSRMMRDVLMMLSEAGAAGGTSVGLHICFDETAPELRETLENFRRQTTIVEEVVAAASDRRWGEINLWAVTAPSEDAYSEARSPNVRAWLDGYEQGDRTSCPSPLATGHVEFDDAVAELMQALRSCLRASRAAESPGTRRYATFAKNRQRDFGDGWLGGAMASLDSDMAVGSVLRSYDAMPAKPGWNAERATAMAAHLRTELAKAPPSLSASKRVQRTLDLLDLPIWKRRHELYSVWVATLVRKAAANAMPPVPWIWQPKDGVLSFPFSGSVVAELSVSGTSIYFWAELKRKSLSTGKKGRKHIQPDYTLLLGADRMSSPAGLVIECKQYRRPSASNFTAAIEDYAHTHANAPLALFNYGPIGTASQATAASVSKDRSAPAVAIGKVWPSASGEAVAVEWLTTMLSHQEALRKILIPDPPAPPAERNVQIKVALELTWTEGGDLDLHLFGDCGDHVYYGQLGSLVKPPFMRLDGDVREPGSEHGKIAVCRRGLCRVEVILFGESAPAYGTATLILTIGDERRSFQSSAHAWRNWTVCTIDLETGRIDEAEIERSTSDLQRSLEPDLGSACH